MKPSMSAAPIGMLVACILPLISIQVCWATVQPRNNLYEGLDGMTGELFDALSSAKALTVSLERSLVLLSNRALDSDDYAASVGDRKVISPHHKRQDPLGLGGRFGRR